MRISERVCIRRLDHAMLRSALNLYYCNTGNKILILESLKGVMKLLNISLVCLCVCVSVYICVPVPSGPLEDGLEEEEEECVSEENELLAKDEFSVEENFTAEFETENISCEDMEYFCNKGERTRPKPKLHRRASSCSVQPSFLFLNT